MNIGFWLLALTVLAGAGIYGYLRSMRYRADEIPDNEDTGAVLVAFSNAYPDRPIRDILHTEDRTGALLRIADGTVGLVRVTPHHTSVSLLKPGDLLVDAADNDRTLHLHFTGGNPDEGIFTFATVAEAAEASLWLCGNFVPPGEADEPEANSSR